MNVVFTATSTLLAVAGALMLYRLLRGPTSFDRVVALEALVVIIVSGVVVDAAAHRESAHVILLAVVALVGFISSVAVLRLLPEDRL